MNPAWIRIRAVTFTDFRIRIRRSSTAAIFLLLCITAYLWIPDPATGRALLQMKEQRALYNSPALAMATASLCSILLGLVGYYLVSNSIGRDTRTRTGFVIASTGIRNSEYLVGIFLGNMLFLSAVVFGFLVSCMVMQLVRGEAPLQFSAFLWHYGILLPPMVVFVSAIAVLFESVRWLSGRFGDVVYFFVWMFTLAFVAVSAEKVMERNWTSYFDTFSFAFMLEQVKKITHSDSISIGSSSYDLSKPPFIFSGLKLPSAWILPRVVSTLYPLGFVAAALLFFNRFHPLKVKSSQLNSRRSILTRINNLVRPLTVPLFVRAQLFLKPGLFSQIFSEVLLTLQLNPLTIFLIVGFGTLSVFCEITTLQQRILPAIFVAIAMLVADLPIRERRAGTTGMIESLPLLKRHFIFWKTGAGLILVSLLIAIPVARLVVFDLSSALSLAIGGLFIVSSAIGIGLASGNPKTFMVTFLMFLYLVMNDHGKTPGFDFAGWFGTATAAVQGFYLALSAGMILSGLVVYRYQQRSR